MTNKNSKNLTIILTGIVIIATGFIMAPSIGAYNGTASYEWTSDTPNYNPSVIFHTGTINISQLLMGNYLGISSSQPNASQYGDSGTSVNWDDTWQDNVGNPNTNGDQLDGRWVQVGKKVQTGYLLEDGWWDLGFSANKVVIFLSLDHPKYLGEGLETRVYGSNTLWNSTGNQATLKEVYLDGWRIHNSNEDKNKNGWTSDDIVGVYELPGNYRYIKITGWRPYSSPDDYSEPEVDAIGFIPVAPSIPTVDIKANNSDGPITIPYNNSANLTWTSSNANSCTAYANWSGSKSISGSELTNNLTSAKTYSITCYGTGGSASDSVVVNVENINLSVNLTATPNSGCTPLEGVDLTANVSGNTSNSITYKFDCQNDGSWENISTRNNNSYTAYNVCEYFIPGNYTAKVRIESGGQTAEDTVNINASSNCYYQNVSVDIKANNSDGPITIPYNNSANLTWTSTNANSCYGYNAWSGSKSTYGSTSTNSLTSSKTYTITCNGYSGGSATDSVTINLSGSGISYLTVNKLVRNLSDGTSWSDLTYADPTEFISYSISVKLENNSSNLSNVVITDILPDKIIYKGNLKIDGVDSSGSIISGLNIGYLSSDQTRTISFDAQVRGKEYFSSGQTRLTNTVTAYSGGIYGSDSIDLLVNKNNALATATTIVTGLTDNILFDSFILPLLIALAVVLIFRSRIINFQKWLDSKKEKYQDYCSKKMLQFKIAKIKTKELLKKMM